MHSIALFRSGFRSTLKLGLALLMAGCAALPSASGQGVPPPTLQLSVGSGICPEGWDWQLYLQAHIENRRFFGYEPVILSLDSQLPLLGGANYVRGPLWGGYGSDSVTAYSAAALPGTYNVTARASTAEWMLEFAEQPWMIDWVTSILGTDLLEATVTKTVTVVGLTEVTADRQHVAIGDTVNLTATMTPIDAFDWVWWDWAPGAWWPFLGQTYSPTMNGYGRDANGVVTVSATCGNKTFTVPITVYQITDLSVSSDLVAVGENLIFTATIDPPGGTPPLIEWFVDGVSQGPPAAGSTFSTTALPSGHHTISAKLGTSEQYAATTVVGIGSVSMSGQDYHGPAPAGEIKYVYKNDTYTFTAFTTPEGAAWPLNQPVWTINGATTINSAASATFSTVSTTISDLKNAVARCGTSSATVAAIVFNLDLQAQPATDFPNRSTTEFGLGEIIVYKAFVAPPELTFEMIGLGWFADCPSGSANAPFITNFPTSAPLSAAAASSAISSSGSIGGDPAPSSEAVLRSWIAREININIARRTVIGVKNRPDWLRTHSAKFIEPTGVSYEKLTEIVTLDNPLDEDSRAIGPQAIHKQNTITLLQGFNTWILPSHVSFEHIQVREGRSECNRFGVLNTPTVFSEAVYVHPLGRALDVGKPSTFKGSKCLATDLAGAWGDKAEAPNYLTDSYDRGFLPVEYRTTEDSLDPWLPLDIVSFLFVVQSNGDFKFKKDDKQFNSSFAAPTILYP